MPVISRIRKSPNRDLILVIIFVIFLVIVAIVVILKLLNKRRINKITREQFSGYLGACEEIFSKSPLDHPSCSSNRIIEISGIDSKTEDLIRQNKYFLVRKFPEVIDERISDITKEQFRKYVAANRKINKELMEKRDYGSIHKKEIAEESGLGLEIVSRIVMYDTSFYGNPFLRKSFCTALIFSIAL